MTEKTTQKYQIRDEVIHMSPGQTLQFKVTPGAVIHGISGKLHVFDEPGWMSETMIQNCRLIVPAQVLVLPKSIWLRLEAEGTVQFGLRQTVRAPSQNLDLGLGTWQRLLQRLRTLLLRLG